MLKSPLTYTVASASDKVLLHNIESASPIAQIESITQTQITAVAWSHNSKFVLDRNRHSRYHNCDLRKKRKSNPLSLWERWNYDLKLANCAKRHNYY